MAITDIAKRVDEKLWQKCLVCHELEKLPADQATALRELLANPQVRYKDLERDLATDPDFPLVIPWERLSRHARGGCAARENLRVSKRAS